MRWIRLPPVTSEVVLVCVALYLGCAFQSIWNHERLDEVQRSWGAIQARTFLDVHEGLQRSPELELKGPFDVWDGEWWRIPLSSFHHDDAFFLVLNLAAACYLGSRLERYWGHLTFAMFLISAVCIPTMAELAVGHAVNGFAGANAALFGALVVLREFDQRLDRAVPVQAAYLGAGAFLLGLSAHFFGWRDVPVLSLVVGFCYGVLMGWMFGGPLKRWAVSRVILVLLHLWMLPALWMVVHPTWSGRYFWYRAVMAQNLDRSERYLERATRCDPSLPAVWLRWSRNAEVQHDPLEAWSRLVRGLVANPSSSPLMEGTRRHWRRLGVAERQYAIEILHQVFGQWSGAWLAQIRSDGTSIVPKTEENSDGISPQINLREFALDQKLILPDLDAFSGQVRKSGVRAPVEPDEAVEGKTL